MLFSKTPDISDGIIVRYITITVMAWSKGRSGFERLVSEVVGANPAWDMKVRISMFLVCYVEYGRSSPRGSLLPPMGLTICPKLSLFQKQYLLNNLTQ
jgi:hypothetical protein